MFLFKNNVNLISIKNYIMKKIYLVLLALIANLFSSQIIFQEDFDGIAGPTAGGAGTYTFPSGWLLRNVDNRTPASAVAYVNDAWERREDFSNNVLDSVAISTSWYNPFGAANDWMWTPEVTLPSTGNFKMKWNAIAYDPEYRDGYEVRIMLSPNVPTGGSGTIGNQITNSTVLTSVAAENSAWTAREIDLTSYLGSTFRIAFRNNSNDKFLLLIDDVVIGENSTLDNMEVPRKNNFFISQNPVKNKTLMVHSLEAASATLYDATGKKVTSFDLIKGSNSISLKIPKGNYILKTNGGFSSKLIVE